MILLSIFFSFIAVSAGGIEFPIGIFGVPPEAPAKVLSEAGFTHVLITDGSLEPQLLESKRLKAFGLATIAYLMAPPASDVIPRRHPFSHWYVADEPEIYGQSPADIAEIVSKIRLQDAKTPVTLVVSDGRRASEFAPLVDTIMVDWYPVPHLPLASSGEHVEFAVKGAGGKPVWAVIQAMDWRDYPQRDPKKPRIGRFPNRRELRFMTFHAIIRGACGIFFFELRKRTAPERSLLDEPEHWAALRAVAKEVSVLAPILSSSSGIRLDSAGFEGRSWRHGGKQLFLLVNRSNVPSTLPPEFCNERARTLFEARQKPSEVFSQCLIPAGRAVALILPHSTTR